MVHSALKPSNEVDKKINKCIDCRIPNIAMGKDINMEKCRYQRRVMESVVVTTRYYVQ